MGTESLGVIGCIFAENGPLEGGTESSFWGTGWGAKGDFRWIFGPNPCIFEGSPSPFSESTYPQVWAQKVWEWSDVYSRRMGPECRIESSFSGTGWGAKGDFRWIFGPNPCIFEGGPPTIFRQQMPSGMGTESLGVIGCIFAENGPLECRIESSFSGTGWGAKGDFRWIFGPNPCIFEGGPPPFSESKCPQVWAQKVWEWSDVYSRRMGP